MDFSLSKITNASTQCTKDIQRIFNGYKTKDRISTAIFDSMATPQLFSIRNTVDLGDMSSCIGINNMQPTPDISVQHCIMVYTRTTVSGTFHNQFGLCVPKSCSMVELKSYVEGYLKINNFPNWTNIGFGKEWCKTGEYNVDKKDITILCIFAILLTLVFASTIYDLYISKFQSGTPKLLFSSFSLNRNLKDLFKVQSHVKKEGAIMFRSMFGIRILSIYWILHGHTLGQLGRFPAIHLKEAYDRFYHPVLIRGYAVDGFFAMSGCLCAYGVLKNGKGLKLKDLPSFLMKRYIRLTPLIAVVIMMQIIIGKYIETQWPFNEYVRSEISRCENLWWINLLYIWWMRDMANTCCPWMWYLAVEFHLFILAAVILAVANFLKKDSHVFKLIAFSAAAFIVFILYRIYNQKTDYAYKPGGRAAGFLIGMFLGCWFSFKTKHQQTDVIINGSIIQKRTLQILFYLSWVVVLCIFWINFKVYQIKPLPRYVNILLQALHRPAFSLAVTLIIACCETGHGGAIGWLLSQEWLEPLGKLNYGVYLLHMPVISVLYLTYGTPVYHSEFQTFMRTIAVYGMTALLCIPLYACVELPFAHLANLLFKKTEAKYEAIKNKD